MFERATKLKLRFESSKGQLSVEDLWDLPFTGDCSLNSLAIALHKKLESSTVSFVEEKSASESRDDLRFEIIKSVIASRKAEVAEQDNKREREARNRKIMGIIEEKKDEALSKKSVKELEKLLS